MITGDRVPHPYPHHHRRRHAVALLACVALLAASALVRPAAGAASTRTPAAPGARTPGRAAAASAPPWPAAPDWQSYVETPSSPDVCPLAIQGTSGTVSGAQNLVCGGSGGATLTMTSGGATPTITTPASAARRSRLPSPPAAGTP